MTTSISAYVAQIAHLAAVEGGAPSRRTRDPRIDLLNLHLAEVHSMPLSRIVELVAQALARRARRGRKRRVQRRVRPHARVDEHHAANLYQGPME